MALYYILLIFINVKILISFQNPSISLKKIWFLHSFNLSWGNAHTPALPRVHLSQPSQPAQRRHRSDVHRPGKESRSHRQHTAPTKTAGQTPSAPPSAKTSSSSWTNSTSSSKWPASIAKSSPRSKPNSTSPNPSAARRRRPRWKNNSLNMSEIWQIRSSYHPPNERSRHRDNLSFPSKALNFTG